MTTADASAGGTGSTTSGSDQGSGTKNQESSNQDQSKEKLVPWEDHQRAVRDMLRFKDQSKTLATQLAEVNAKLDQIQTERATQDKNFEALYSQEKSKREELETQKTKLLGSVVQSERYRAVFPALKKAGLRDDAENLLDHWSMDSIEVESTSSGRFSVSGVESFVEQMKKDYAYAFQKPKDPNVNGSSGNGTVKETQLTPEGLFKIEQECKKKGDMAPYKAAVLEWQKQKQRKTS